MATTLVNCLDAHSVGRAGSSTPAGDNNHMVALLEDAPAKANGDTCVDASIYILRPVIELGLCIEQWQNSAPQVALSGCLSIARDGDDRTTGLVF